MGNHPISCDVFITFQPLWKVTVKETDLLLDEQGQVLAQLMHIVYETQELDSFPGIGLVTLMIPILPPLKDAVLFGVLHERSVISMIGMVESYAVRFLPGVFARIFKVSAADISPFGKIGRASWRVRV